MVKAFKEWAYIVDALGKGKQNIILRKGGIVEEGGDFALQAKEFVLFPTQFHQTTDLIKPDWIKDLDGQQYQKDERHVWLQYYAQVADTKLIKDWITLKKLEKYHAWTEDVIRERFNRWQQEVHLMVMMVYRLKEPIAVEIKPQYTGCKSWIDLDEQVVLEGTPVINTAIR